MNHSEKPLVFISFKNSDGDIITQDAVIAEQAYHMLEDRGIKTFYSNITLMETGESDYTDAIDEALDNATVMLLLSSKIEYLQSKWIKREWRLFESEITETDGEKGIIVPYFSETIEKQDRPVTLRRMQTFLIEKDDLEKVIVFIDNYLVHKGLIEPFDRRFKENSGIKEHSKYNSLAMNEKERLEYQCRLTRDSDMPAILEVVDTFKNEEKIYILDLGCAQGHTISDRYKDFPYKNIHVVGIDKNTDVIEVAKKNNPGDSFHFAAIEIECDTFEENIKAYMEKEGIPHFHLVTSTVFLRHLKQPVVTLKRIHKILAPGGFIMIREQDSGNCIAYGDQGLTKDIIDTYLSIPGITDQFYGRKVYNQLIESGFKNIESMHTVRDLTGKDKKYRQAVFSMSFQKMENFMQFMDETLANDKSLNATRIRLGNYLKKLYELFLSDSYWYQEVDLIFLAKK